MHPGGLCLPISWPGAYWPLVRRSRLDRFMDCLVHDVFLNHVASLGWLASVLYTRDVKMTRFAAAPLSMSDYRQGEAYGSRIPSLDV